MLVCRLGHIGGGKQITKILDGMKGDQRDAADEVRGFFQLGASYGSQDCNTKLRFLLPTGKRNGERENVSRSFSHLIASFSLFFPVIMEQSTRRRVYFR